MSMPSVAKQMRQAKKRKMKALRQRQAAQGSSPKVKSTLPNRNSKWKTPEEEIAARQEIMESTLQVYRALLPGWLADVAKMEDPRQQPKVKHQLKVLLLYGLFSFVFQMSSRREAGREMTKPVFYENLKRLIPELESLPHQDTLYRLLAKIEVDDIETAHLNLLRRLIRSKKFVNYLVKKRYLIAIDGTQKFTLDECWGEEFLQRHPKGKEEASQYYVYLLEAKFIFPNGMVLPLMSQFCDNTVDTVNTKQDCELKAFKRLAQRLHQAFPKLAITLLLDGLYPNGPIMDICRKNKWEFMMVLQDDSLSNVWKEANGLRKLHPERVYHQTWNGRQQTFWWSNNIVHEYETNGCQKQKVHLVVCEETWEEIGSEGDIVTKTSRHAWLSSEPLREKNVHIRCNLMGRARWGLENDILKEKHQGYSYEHVFSHDWNAMKGYHYLMHLGHLINELVQHSIDLIEQVKEFGIRGFLHLLRETIAGPWMDKDRIKSLLTKRHQLRLAY